MANNSSWFIAVVTPNTEKSCKEKLEKLSAVETYVPIQRELHEWPSTGKRVWVDRVLCPCYLFIHCTDRERYEIACKAKFILHFLMDRAREDANGRNDFARIPQAQMTDFMRMVGDADTPITIDTSRLQVGSKVRIKTGRLAGLEGYVYRKPNGSTQLALCVDMLGYAVMDCPIELLELVEEK